MKNFIGKNWKKILIVIGSIFLAIDLIFIIITPATIPQDFYEYGPNVENDLFDTTSNIAGGITNELTESGDSEFINNASEDTGISPNNLRTVLIFGALLLGVLILSAIIDGPDDKKK